MKKALFLIAAACLAFAACNQKEPEPTPVYESVAFKTFGFTAQDNQGVILSDIVIDASLSGKMEFTLPFGTDEEALKSLVPSFELSLGADVAPDAVVMIGETEYQAGSPVDFSSIVDFVVKNGDKNTLYSVAVSIKGAPAWTLAATSDIDMGSELIMKINPKDNQPYMLGYVSGSAASEHYPVLLGVNGDKLSAVADTLDKVQSNYFGLDFDMDGNAYVTYYNNPEKLQTAGIISGGNFTKIGTTIRSTCNTVTSAPVAAIDANNVFFGCMANAATAGVPKRGLYAVNYNGSELSSQPVQIGDWALANTTYNALTRKVNGVNYMLCLDFNNVAIGVYKYENNGWTNIAGETIKPLKVDGTPITTAEYSYQSIGFDVDSKGNIYMLAHADFEGETKQPAVVKYDPVTKTQTIIGGVIKDENFLHSNCRYSAIAVDALGNPYVIFANTFTAETGGACSLMYIDSKTKAWSQPVTITPKKVSGLDIKFNSENKGFVCVYNYEDNKYELYVTE